MKNLRLPLLLGLVVALCAPLATSVRAVSSTIVISEFRTRGTLGGNDEFVEIHNLSNASVDISGWKIRASNAAGTVGTRVTINAGTVLGPGCFFLAVNSTATTGYSGSVPGNQTFATGITDDGGVAVTLPNDTVVDQVGMSAGSAFKEGTTLAPTTANANRGIERKPGGGAGHADTDSNSADFQAISPGNPQNLSSACINYGGASLAVAASAAPNPVVQSNDTLVVGAVSLASGTTAADIVSVTADLTPLGGAPGTPLRDDGLEGDVTAGDLRYSYRQAVTAAPGTYAVTVSVADSQGGADTDTVSVVVEAPPPLFKPHEIQGSDLTSPRVGQSVTVEGVVTGRRSNGVFIQTLVGAEDSDPNTSEGLFVFTSSAPAAAASVGKRVWATGTVTEFSGDGLGLRFTELSNSPTFTVFEDVALPAAVPLTGASLSPGGGVNQLERFEAMRVVVSLTTVSGTGGFFTTATGGEASGVITSDGVFYAVIAGTPRPEREPGLDFQIAGTFASQCDSGAPCSIPVFDGNPERLRVDSDALGAPRLDVTSNVTIANVEGIIDSGFFTWGLLPTPAAPGTAGANLTGTGVSTPAPTAFTVASFNVQRFFDTVNDPGVDDVALTQENFDGRLIKASLIVRTALKMPDVLAVQEVENLGVLQALAARINADAGLPGEYTAYLQEGNDIGGIDVGFLVRARVSVASVTQYGKDDLLMNPDTGQPYLNNDGSPQKLNDRPSLVLRATVQAPAGYADSNVIVVANHLRSLGGVADADPRVRRKRQQQSEFLASLLETLQDEGAVISVGDYNAFDFSDGLVDVMGTVLGDPSPANEVVIASNDLVEPNFSLTSPGVYSYVFDGNAQTLDHVILSSQAVTRFTMLEHARVNADFPEIYRNDPARIERLSDHDPAVAFFGFAVTRCDADADDAITTADLAIIRAAYGPAANGNDARDGNGDGTINALDVRYCQLRRTPPASQ